MSSTFTDLLVLADTPTKETGFGVVVQNLLPVWRHKFKRIDIFGINYHGEFHELPYRIVPMAMTQANWNHQANLQRFLAALESGRYSHVWIMQDTFMLSNGWFPKKLQEVCARKKVQCLLYFPVDSALDPAWTDIILRSQTPVAYTQYGLMQVVEALKRAGLKDDAIKRVVERIAILPHGVDREVFKPLSNIEKLRAERIQGMPDNGFLMINVNANQRRKDPTRSLEILAELKRRDVPAWLMMQMPRVSLDGIDLEVAGGQLGLTHGKDWWHGGEYFKGNTRLLSKEELNTFYNIAHLMLTTTKGEGWGLSTTEALAVGLPVAMPKHTACEEIAATMRQLSGDNDPACAPIIELPLDADVQIDGLDNSRARRRVNVMGAADAIEQAWRNGVFEQRRPLNKKARSWLSWMRIAHEWLDLMAVGCTIKIVEPKKEEPKTETPDLVPSTNLEAATSKEEPVK